MVSALLNVLFVVMLLMQVNKYQPAVEIVTLDGGYPVVWNDAGNPVIDDVEYVPARLRAVVESFIEHRYEYDWQNLTKINTALRLMSDDAQAAEREKFLDLNPRETIVATQTKVELDLDYSNWEVSALGEGRFEVSVPGEALITDAVRNTDPRNPLVKPFTVDLTVETVKPTDINPLGYRIIATGRDIL